ncbi:MAG: peptidylprolyl isomerase [Gammaproteobacteria bacterium]|nr:peptidylprolyl isomerase [Gammaproteobacteria bacterium]
MNDSELAAIVNGEQISNLQVQRHAAQRGSGDAPADPAVATQELINLLLLSQEATRRGLHTQPATVEELARQRIAVLANALLENQMETMQIEEADLRAEYRSQTTAMEDTEYQARHILLSDKQQADEVIDQLRFGADFDELARTKSTGPSAKQGGALGWFRAGQMVPPFSQALHRLQVGEVSEPVQTKFGWHVIQLQNKRKVPVPEFAAVEARLQTIVRNKRLRELVDGLRAKAEIELRSAH